MSTDATEKKIERGNVCVSQKGLLFIAINMFALPKPGIRTNAWYGIAFNGEAVQEENCAFVANNLNEYLHDTYGENYAGELAQAAQP